MKPNTDAYLTSIDGLSVLMLASSHPQRAWMQAVRWRRRLEECAGVLPVSLWVGFEPDAVLDDLDGAEVVRALALAALRPEGFYGEGVRLEALARTAGLPLRSPCPVQETPPSSEDVVGDDQIVEMEAWAFPRSRSNLTGACQSAPENVSSDVNEISVLASLEGLTTATPEPIVTSAFDCAPLDVVGQVPALAASAACAPSCVDNQGVEEEGGQGDTRQGDLFTASAASPQEDVVAPDQESTPGDDKVTDCTPCRERVFEVAAAFSKPVDEVTPESEASIWDGYGAPESWSLEEVLPRPDRFELDLEPVAPSTQSVDQAFDVVEAVSETNTIEEGGPCPSLQQDASVVLPPLETCGVDPSPGVVTEDDVVATAPAQRVTCRVHSGQVVETPGDLVALKTVGMGGELQAGGSIHAYGPLIGRAMAGIYGDTSARIYASDFRAELVSIAGCFRVFEEIPEELSGRPVEIWLEGGVLRVAPLGCAG